MAHQPSTLASIECLSLKFTENHLPSLSLIKPSQENISLTYTASMENVSLEKLDFSQILEIQDLSTSIARETLPTRNDKKTKQYFSNLKERQHWSNKDVFNKNSLFKITHLDLSLALEDDKFEQKPEIIKPRKSFIRSNNSGIFSKTKYSKEHNKNQPKTYTKIKDLFNPEPTENMESSSLIRSSRFYSMKNDHQAVQKIIFSIKKQIGKRILSCETERKYNKFPLIKGSNFHKSAPASLHKNKKMLEFHENVSLNDNFIIGKTCKLGENDEKAKKYLKKVIQNRTNVLHFCDHKKNKHFKDFNQNIEEW